MTTIVNDTKLDFSDVLFVPQRTPWASNGSRQGVVLERTFRFKHSKHQITAVPIIAANMDTVGTLQMASTLSKFKMLTALHKFHTVKSLQEYYSDECSGEARSGFAFYSMGISDDDFVKFSAMNFGSWFGEKPILICIDVANGYTEQFFSRIRRVREQLGEYAIIMAGNVVTPEVTIEAIRAGADIVKVGIGSGSVCTTRKVAGVGYPQFSAVLECANAAHSQGGHICSDGGVVHIADIAKAFGAGADFVMCGSMFAGHDECGGEIIHDQDWPHMKFRGMSSREAMEDHYGGKANYRASEGKEVLVSYRGPVSNTAEEMLGGLRSTCTYIGARKLKDIPKCAVFCKVNNTHNKVYGE